MPALSERNLSWAFLRDKEVTIKELYELAMENDLLNGIMGDGRDMSQRTKLGLALGNREGQVWSGKKIVIPKDESGRRRVHRKGSVFTTSSTSAMIQPDRDHRPGPRVHSRMLKLRSGHHPRIILSRRSLRQ